MNLKPWLSCLLSAALVAGCATSRVKKAKNEEGEIVIAEGIAPYHADDLPGTKAASLAAAQRSAVELVVGVYVNAKTRVEKAVAIEQSILTRTEGYVKRYEVLSQTQEGAWYKTKIRALVSTKKLHEDLDSLGMLRRPAVGNPRVTILLREYMGAKELKGGEGSLALTQALINQGFKVVTVGKTGSEDEDPVDLAKSLSRSQVELVIAGMARAQDLAYEKKLGGMSSYRASVALRVIEVGSGEVVASVSQVASGMEATPDLAAGQALKKAAELAAKDLLNLPQELSKRSHVDVTITGLKTFEGLSKFQQSLASEAGVKDLFLRSFSQESGVAVLDVQVSDLSPQDLADRGVRIGGADWSVFQVAGRSVQLMASQAGR